MSTILIADRVPRTATSVHRGAAVLLGSPFVLIGIAIAALVLSEAHDEPVLASMGGRIAIYCVATVFLVCGLLLVLHGIGGIRRERQLQPLRTMHLEEPWRWDHAWDRRGTMDSDLMRRVRARFAMSLLVGCFLVPFHWFGFFAPEPTIFIGIIALLFDLVVIGTLTQAVLLLLRRRRYGLGVALYERFPFHRGQPVELVVGRPAALRDDAQIEATLRCVQERAVTRGSGSSRSTTIECHEVAHVPLTIEDVREGTRRFLRVRGVPPADTLATALSETPSRYWELELVSQVPGIDWRARFLVPVY